MPLWIADYLKKTVHLGALESGAYLHLIMHYWMNNGLPFNDRQLARIAKMTDEEWAANKATLQAFFHHGWKHERVDEELEKIRCTNLARKRAADKRWSNNKDLSDASAYANGYANAPILHTSDNKQESKIEKQGLPVKERDKPKHGQVDRVRNLIYIWTGTSEWTMYAGDYHASIGHAPRIDSRGGAWFQVGGYATPVAGGA